MCRRRTTTRTRVLDALETWSEIPVKIQKIMEYDVVKAPEEPEPDPEGMVPPGPNWTAAIDDQTGKETWVNDATGEVLKAGGAAVDDRSVGSKGSTGKKGPRARRRIKSKGG